MKQRIVYIINKKTHACKFIINYNFKIFVAAKTVVNFFIISTDI